MGRLKSLTVNCLQNIKDANDKWSLPIFLEGLEVFM